MKKNFNFLLKLILLVTIFSIFVANKVMEKSLAIEEQNVVLGITPKPKIDIVLSKAKTEVDLTTFKAQTRSVVFWLPRPPSPLGARGCPHDG